MVTVLFWSGCSNSGNGSDEGFSAELGDFDGYANWELVDYTISEIPGLADAHAATGDAFSRRIYAADGAAPEDGEYPEGSILVKETFTWDEGTGEQVFADTGGLLAMVKRGGDFNTEHERWEWFMLDPSLDAIADRGAGLMDGMCNN